MTDLALEFPNLVSVENYGLSEQGRELRVLKVSTGFGSNKPAVWIDSSKK